MRRTNIEDISLKEIIGQCLVQSLQNTALAYNVTRQLLTPTSATIYDIVMTHKRLLPHTTGMNWVTECLKQEELNHFLSVLL